MSTVVGIVYSKSVGTLSVGLKLSDGTTVQFPESTRLRFLDMGKIRDHQEIVKELQPFDVTFSLTPSPPPTPAPEPAIIAPITHVEQQPAMVTQVSPTEAPKSDALDA